MGSPTKFFGTVRQKVLTENRDISSPPLILIFFRDHKFSEAQIRKVSLQSFSALWDKLFDTKSWHNSLKPKIFRNPKLMTRWWVPLRSFPALSDKKFWQKIVIFPPPLILIFFRDQKISEAQIRKVSLRNFSALWDKIFDTKSWHNSLKPKIFRYPKLMTHWWVPLRSFSALSDKMFWQKIVIFPPPPLILIFFRDHKFSEAQIRKVSLRNFSALWDKIFDTKSWHNSLKPEIFRNPKLMTHWWVPLRSFSALSDKKFWQKIVIFPPPSYPYLFSRPEIFRSTDQKGFSTKFFGTVRQNFRHKIVT